MKQPNTKEESKELRSLKAELNILSRSDGSAMFSQGNTIALSSVSGPVEVKLQKLHVDKSTIEVYYRPKSGLTSVDDRFKENFIEQTCAAALLTGLHPRTSYMIQLQEMEDDGGLLACLINATCLALLNSGLELRFLVAAVNCSIDENGKLTLDPTARQESKAVSSFTFVFERERKTTVASHTTGKFKMDQYKQAVEVCRAASEKIFEFYQNIVENFIKVI